MAQDDPHSRTRLYFVSPLVDFLFIGGLSILVYFWLVHLAPETKIEPIYALAASLTWVCNWPHFSASIYRLYGERDNIKQYPFTALVIPFVIIGMVSASFWSPAIFAPYFVKLFTIWSPYHYSGQSVGITLIYARRSGLQIQKWQRLALAAFIFGSFLVPTLRREAGSPQASYYGVSYPHLGIPLWFSDAAALFMWAGGAVFLGSLLYPYWKRKKSFPLILLLPAVAQYLWLVDGRQYATFNAFVPFFHSFQYLLIVWAMQLKLKMDQYQIQPSRGYVVRESFGWGLINVLGGIFLFYALPRLCSTFGISLPFATGVVIAGVQIHHFFVDGIIWKLRNKGISSPLMVSLEELIRPRPDAPVQRVA